VRARSLSKILTHFADVGDILPELEYFNCRVIQELHSGHVNHADAFHIILATGPADSELERGGLVEHKPIELRRTRLIAPLTQNVRASRSGLTDGNQGGVSRRPLPETRQQWPVMSLYERFEQVVAIILSLVIATVVALALAQLLVGVVPLLVSGAIDPPDYEVFQTLFGMVMTLLIAMEFKHSIIRVVLRRSNIVQVKTVVLREEIKSRLQ
jgi:hypothetical protein